MHNRLRFLACLASMLVLTLSPALADLSLTASPGDSISTQESIIALTGANLIDGTGVAPIVNATVIIRGARVAATGAANSIAIPKNASRIDLDLEVLKAIVAEARANKLRVVVHWGNIAELPDVLQAGPDGLEHVTVSAIPEASIRQIADRGVYVVPTVVAFKQFLPLPALERGILPNIKRLSDAGVKIVAGADTPLGSRFGESLHAEQELLVKAGLTPR